MFGKVQAIEEKYEQLSQQLYDPAVAADAGRYGSVIREYKAIEPIVLKYREYRAAQRQAADARSMLDDAALERELRELAAEELEEARLQEQAAAAELRVLLLPKDPNDDKNVIVEIRGGAGGEEAALFSAVLYRMYSMYAQAHGFAVEVVSANETELGGLKEIHFEVTGDGAYSRLKFESGVHRVQRVPETEAGGRVHTSTATVACGPMCFSQGRHTQRLYRSSSVSQSMRLATSTTRLARRDHRHTR